MKHENSMDNFSEEDYYRIDRYDEESLKNLKVHYYEILKHLG